MRPPCYPEGPSAIEKEEQLGFAAHMRMGQRPLWRMEPEPTAAEGGKRTRPGPPAPAGEGGGHAHTLILSAGFWICERMNFCCVGLPRLVFNSCSHGKPR